MIVEQNGYGYCPAELNSLSLHHDDVDSPTPPKTVGWIENQIHLHGMIQVDQELESKEN